MEDFVLLSGTYAAWERTQVGVYIVLRRVAYKPVMPRKKY